MARFPFRVRLPLAALSAALAMAAALAWALPFPGWGRTMGNSLDLLPPSPQAHPPLGFHIAQADAAHLQAARTAGGTFVVVVFSWADIEPVPNHFYWEGPDAALRAADFYGIQVIARLDRPPDWALDNDYRPPEPATSTGHPAPWRLDAYAHFVRQVALRYGQRLAAIVVWNEPNLGIEWNRQAPDPAGYAALLASAYGSAKDAAPALPVVVAGLAFTTGDGDLAMDDLAYLRALYAAGAAAHFDALAAHPYGFGQPPEQAPAPDRLNFRRLELARAIMAEHGDGGKPVWITEMGWRARAPDPADAWQVVTPAEQATYTLRAMRYARQYEPWLAGMALWELNAQADHYGYGLWRGPGGATPTYAALASTCQARRPDCQADPARAESAERAADLPSTHVILAPDVTVRLGDAGTLHPHWVHLHRPKDGVQGDPAPDWQAEFFLDAGQAGQAHVLVLETMQVEQSTNRVTVNDVPVGNLGPRPGPELTSTWTTQRLAVPASLLQPGVNTVGIASGQRNPARQFGWRRWENFQLRNLRLETQARPNDAGCPAASAPDAAATSPGMEESCRAPLPLAWSPASSPGGWAETVRLRVDDQGALWLIGNRLGQIWRMHQTPTGERLESQAADRLHTVFTDVLAMGQGTLAATQQGIVWQEAGQNGWQRVIGAPESYTYFVVRVENAQGGGPDDRFYAGLEGRGLWTSWQPAGPWQPAGLDGRTVLDLTHDGQGRLFAATDDGVFWLAQSGAEWQPLPAPAGVEGQTGFQPNSAPDAFLSRIVWDDSVAQPQVALLVQSQDRLWRWQGRLPDGPEEEPASGAWQPFGPPDHPGQLTAFLDCCGPGTLVGTHRAGIWQLTPAGWQGYSLAGFDRLDVIALARVQESLYLGASNGLFRWDGEFAICPGGPCQEEQPAPAKVQGLPSTVTSLLVAAGHPACRVAATPAGAYRSLDGGITWASISPPWVIWDAATGPDGRLFLARTGGIAWADAVCSGQPSGRGQDLEPVSWQESQGMEEVHFFRIAPHPNDPMRVWAGSWGNNVGASQDGGETLAPVHNGLETLSVLDVLWHAAPGQTTVATIEGLYRSDDDGETWFKLPGPLAHQTVYSLWQGDDDAIWAGAADGLWASRDWGVHWQKHADLPAATVLRLGAFEDAAGRPWLWAGTEGAGLWVSLDGGSRWQAAGLDGQSVYRLLADPLWPDALMAAGVGGIYRATMTWDRNDP